MNRKKKILFVLATVFAISLCYRIFHPFRQERVSELTYTGKQSSNTFSKRFNAAGDKTTEERCNVRIDLFLNPQQHMTKLLRNIFHKETVRKETGLAEKISPTLILPEFENDTPGGEDQREKIDQELSSFNVFGSFESGDNRILFIERGKDIILVRKGDLIDGKYRIEKITKQAMTLKAENFEETIYIELNDL